MLAVYWAHASTTLSFTRYDPPGPAHGDGAGVVWATVIIAAAANAVNLTDGLDGLAAGSSTFCFACLAIIGYWQFRHFAIYRVPATPSTWPWPSVALAGACLGFLWWNAAPAKIFMGDTGSLSIGSGLAALCLLMNLDLLLVVIGGLFVIETLSVVIQVVSFRVFHRRVFRMAPSTTTSSCWAGPRPPSSSGSGSWPDCSPPSASASSTGTSSRWARCDDPRRTSSRGVPPP